MLTPEEIKNKIENFSDITLSGLYFAKYQRFTREKVSKMWEFRNYRNAFVWTPELFLDSKNDVTIWDTSLQDYLHEKCSFWAELWDNTDKIKFWCMGAYWLQFVPEKLRPLYTYFCIGDTKMLYFYDKCKIAIERGDRYITLIWNDTCMLAGLSLFAVRRLQEMMKTEYGMKINLVYEHE